MGNLLGAKKAGQAKLAAAIATALGVGSMALMSVLILALREQIPYIFVKDPKVIRRIIGIVPFGAGFQVRPSRSLHLSGARVLAQNHDASPLYFATVLGGWGHIYASTHQLAAVTLAGSNALLCSLRRAGDDRCRAPRRVAQACGSVDLLWTCPTTAHCLPPFAPCRHATTLTPSHP